MESRTYSTWTPQKPTLFSGHYLHNRSTLDIGVLGYIGIVQHKVQHMEHSPEVLSIPPGTPCIQKQVNYSKRLKYLLHLLFVWILYFLLYNLFVIEYIDIYSLKQSSN